MKKQRKHYAPEEKVAILRRHSVEGVPISDPCDERGLQPTVFYRWQNEFFSDYFRWADFPGVDSKPTPRPEGMRSPCVFSVGLPV